MSGQSIRRRGATKLKRSQSIRFLLLSTTQRVFNQGRSLKDEVKWKSMTTLRHYGDGTGGFQIKWYNTWSKNIMSHGGLLDWFHTSKCYG